MSELRHDSIRKIWVIIAGDRGKRPSDFQVSVQTRDQSNCPFCPGNESETPDPILEHKNSDGSWKLRLVPNRFPVLDSNSIHLSEESFFHKQVAGNGRHEVLIECAEHSLRWGELSEDHLCEILRIYSERMKVHIRDGFRYTAIFRNVGYRGGATLSHPHSQILAMPIIPPALEVEIESSAEYFAKNKTCIYCDLLISELSDRHRIVADEDEFVVLTPFASRFAYEMLLVPKKHESDFSSLSDRELESAARVLKKTIRAMDSALNSPDYNLILHSVPAGASTTFHWHFELLPRLAFQAGFEWGTAIHIVSTPPETAAKTISSYFDKL